MKFSKVKSIIAYIAVLSMIFNGGVSTVYASEDCNELLFDAVCDISESNELSYSEEDLINLSEDLSSDEERCEELIDDYSDKELLSSDEIKLALDDDLVIVTASANELNEVSEAYSLASDTVFGTVSPYDDAYKLNWTYDISGKKLAVSGKWGKDYSPNGRIQKIISEIKNKNYTYEVETVEVNINNPTNLEGLLSGCDEVTKIDLSSMNLTNVTTMSNLFNGCLKVTQIVFPSKSYTTKNLTNISGMYENCQNSKSIFLNIKIKNLKVKFNG